MKLRIYRIVHLVITGVITIPITLFMASGGLGENYTDHTFVYPGFLLIIGIWIVGSVLSFVRKSAVLGLIISALPALYFIGNILFTFL